MPPVALVSMQLCCVGLADDVAVSSSRFLTFRFLLRLRRGDFLPGGRAPGLPRRAGEDHVPIGTPAGDPPWSRVSASQGQQFLPRADIPKLDGLLPAVSRKQPTSIRGESAPEGDDEVSAEGVKPLSQCGIQ